MDVHDKRGTKMTRDCDTCVHHTADGCAVWKCDYINYDDAVAAYKRYDGLDLILCADCKFCEERGEHALYAGYYYCTQWKTMNDPKGYCWKAERSRR